MSDVQSPSMTAHLSEHDPSFAAKPTGEASAPQAVEFWILVTLSLGLWWGIWLAVRSVSFGFAM